ncbi:MAG TPA: PfkB family carbohydrate kinase [archaeon]|nr:PfkB family carbohydrate kinase [archaeon]
MPKEKKTPRKLTFTCVGTGLIALDMVTNGDRGDAPRFWAGGSCGNVLTILAYLGWYSYPIARLGNDIAAKTIAKDMSEHGVDLQYISYDESVNTPIILQRILSAPDGNPTHRFYWVCPNCGNWLPRYRAILLQEVRELGTNLPGMSCFYFDRVSAAALYLASKARDQGALVVFEPATIKEDNQFEKAMSVCDVLKYSNEHMKNFDQSTYESSAPIVIETLGAEGLRYRLRGNGKCDDWKFLPAFRVANLKDAAGAGDWCTAGVVDMLIKEGTTPLKRVSKTEIVDALRYGQALSALNCSFEGARGSMYGLEKNQFGDEVQAILDRKEARKSVIDTLSPKAKKTVQCVCPACQAALKNCRKKC